MKHSFIFTSAVILSMGVLLPAGCCTPSTKNIFHDKTLQQIYTLQNQRNTAELLPFLLIPQKSVQKKQGFETLSSKKENPGAVQGGLGRRPILKNENPVYRKAAVIAFASVQDPAAVLPLAELFADADEGIRSAAAYALGQTGNNTAEPILIKTYQTEKSAAVKQDILEALGKCGTIEGLAFLTRLDIPPGETSLLTGQAWGLYRFAIRNIVSPQGTARAVELINPTKQEKVRFIAANYLSRTRGIDLQEYSAQLLQAFEKEQNLFTRMNLVSAMGKAVKPEILDCLKALLTQGNIVDCRVKVNALRALQGFDYQNTRELLLNGVKNENVNVSVTASEFLLASGKNEDAQAYLDTALNLTHVRTRAALLAAALKYAAKDNKELRDKISGVIMDAYKKAPDNYAKAYYLGALAGDYVHYAFVQAETFANKGNIIGSTGITALVEMGRDANEKKAEKMMPVFAGIFQEAIGIGDPALIGTAAGILREPAMNFKTYFKDISFLTAALDKCQLPQDIDAYLELRQTMDFFNGTKTAAEKPPLHNKPIDWQLVTSIDPDQQVKIKTVKGNIVIRLLVNESPGSASNFVQLVKDGFYKESYIHRVAPNFVIQDGCPRGDGWGSPPYSIGSELGPRYYEEGSVGMASSGKDTESSQWFITHSPTPHLDGRYTIFGQVVSGMEVVHKLEVGDKILGFELL